MPCSGTQLPQLLGAAAVVFLGAATLLIVAWVRRGKPGLPLFGRREDVAGGMVIGFGRRDEASSFDTRPDWELVPAVAERLVRRIPAMADAPIMRAWAGLYEMTPDQMGILSAVPGVDGLYVIAGFSGHGFMHGPIAGQLMAEMLVHGRAVTMDASGLDLARFARGEAHVEPLTFV